MLNFPPLPTTFTNGLQAQAQNPATFSPALLSSLLPSQNESFSVASPANQQLLLLRLLIFVLISILQNGFPQDPPPIDPPPVDPPVDPPPVDPPTDPPDEEPPIDLDPHFTPGTLALEDTPVDENGNVTNAFVQAILTPENPVDDNLFDESHPSGMSDFARQGIRMLGHDLYDGQIDGDVVLRTLFNPEGSHNSAFTATEQSTDIAQEWGRRDLEDDGVINGSAYVQLIEDVWPHTDDAAIPGFAGRRTYTAANLNAEELFRNTTDVASPQGIAEFTQTSGISATQLLNFSYWGHRIMDTNFTTQQIVQESLTDPTSIDFGFTHLNDETMAFANSLANNPDADREVGFDVLSLLALHLTA